MCAAPSDDLSRRDFVQLATGLASAFVLTEPPTTDAPHPQAAAGQRTTLRLTVNGARQDLTVDTRTSLLEVLRDDLRLTGTRLGCNQGACGACTVLVDGRRVLACLTLAASADGSAVTTVEGLSAGESLHPLQAAFIEHEAFQCGFCTAGQLISGVACIAEGHAGSPEEIRAWMSGNLCRCGAYPGIVAAIDDVARRS